MEDFSGWLDIYLFPYTPTLHKRALNVSSPKLEPQTRTNIQNDYDYLHVGRVELFTYRNFITISVTMHNYSSFKFKHPVIQYLSILNIACDGTTLVFSTIPDCLFSS